MISYSNTLPYFKRINNKIIGVQSVRSQRFYSSLNVNKPLPSSVIILTIKDLYDKERVKSYYNTLKSKGGIYSFLNTVNGNQYIGSAKDLYLRLNEHLDNRKSNTALQKAISKYGLDKFHFCVYEYFTYDSKIISSKGLTDLETSYIAKFDFNTLYNFKAIATSMSGYKHTKEAVLKMIKRFENKNNHPMYGKTHTKEAISLISKPGKLNPMYGKKHSEKTKSILSDKKNKYPLGVGVYDLNNNLMLKFKNNVEIAKHFNISKVTVGKYLNNDLIYDKIYKFKPIEG